MELSDKAFGVSNPLYIKRQAEILANSSATMSEIESFLSEHDNDETSHIHAFGIAKRKFVDLKGLRGIECRSWCKKLHFSCRAYRPSLEDYS